MNSTIKFYGLNAKSYVEGTKEVDFSEVENRFLSYLPEKAYILDYGCGSGRDTKYFLDKGFQVDAMDGAAELCKIASSYTGIPVKHMLFQDLNEHEKYDGIWACASILHALKIELPDVFRRMIRALKAEGIIYTSFKYGNFEGERNGRYFTCFTEESFRKFMKQFPELQVLDEWISSDVRPDRKEETWLNLIIRKSIIS